MTVRELTGCMAGPAEIQIEGGRERYQGSHLVVSVPELLHRGEAGEDDLVLFPVCSLVPAGEPEGPGRVEGVLGPADAGRDTDAAGAGGEAHVHPLVSRHRAVVEDRGVRVNKLDVLLGFGKTRRGEEDEAIPDERPCDWPSRLKVFTSAVVCRHSSMGSTQ